MDVNDFRREHLKRYVGQFSLDHEAAEALQRSPSQISQLLRNKDMGKNLARSLEKLAGAEEGAWDKPPDPQDQTPSIVMVGPNDGGKLTYVAKVKGAKLSAGPGEIPEVLWDIDEVQRSHGFREDYMQERGLNPERCKVWSVRGESMEPRYRSGDIVLIDMSSREPIHGKVFALIGDDGLRIKQLRRGATHWEMHSFNPDQNRYPPEPIIGESHAIIGRVRWRGGDED